MARHAGQQDGVRIVGAVRVVRRGRDWSDSRLSRLGVGLVERIDVAGTAAHGESPTLRVRRARGDGFLAVVVQRGDGVGVIGLDRHGDEWTARLPRIPAGTHATLYIIAVADAADLQALREAVSRRGPRAKPPRPRPEAMLDDVVIGGGRVDGGGAIDAAEPPPEFLPQAPRAPGAFDNDPATMESVARRVAGVDKVTRFSRWRDPPHRCHRLPGRCRTARAPRREPNARSASG